MHYRVESKMTKAWKMKHSKFVYVSPSTPVYHVVDKDNNVICYTVRRNKADRICKALNNMERRYDV